MLSAQADDGMAHDDAEENAEAALWLLSLLLLPIVYPTMALLPTAGIPARRYSGLVEGEGEEEEEA